MPVGPIPGDFAPLVGLARENRPELVALREGERALGALARAERAGFFPTSSPWGSSPSRTRRGATGSRPAT